MVTVVSEPSALSPALVSCLPHADALNLVHLLAKSAISCVLAWESWIQLANLLFSFICVGCKRKRCMFWPVAADSTHPGHWQYFFVHSNHINKS